MVANKDESQGNVTTNAKGRGLKIYKLMNSYEIELLNFKK